MQEPVKDRDGLDLVAEQLRPLGHALVAGVADEVAGAERFHRQPHGQMRLSDPGRAQDQRRHLVLHEPQRAQLGEAFGVELGLEGGVELIEGLVVRQPGELQPRRVAPTFEDADLRLEDEVEELAVAERPGLGAVDKLIGGVRETVKQRAGMPACRPERVAAASQPDARAIARAGLCMARCRLGQTLTR